MRIRNTKLAAAVLAVLASSTASASSHREAPAITRTPAVDATDFYMFRSYEPGRSGYVTLIANYIPLQDPYGGPNYFALDDRALYEIHIDQDGDAREDLTYQFRFVNKLAAGDKGIALNVGGQKVAVPLKNIGPVSAGDRSALNFLESYSVRQVSDDRRTGKGAYLRRAADGGTSFRKPYDFVGTKTFGSAEAYEDYARSFIYEVTIPGCDASWCVASLVPTMGGCGRFPASSSVGSSKRCRKSPLISEPSIHLCPVPGRPVAPLFLATERARTRQG